ncbi:autotransporter assembly complex protein TamA [Halomonas vilamensis]|uniref:Translocation and assembly module subunit TamA n=1 Tax=Vreelandella vilamensis TaxID=531309 RepID=A0ABU1H1T1_9GAMM|nr:autotransporter assembly complex family protein [Halomonas vilamensis]MDR5898264.1 autotransporter assembly complex protein TamA [Halomonas vilamensis]
MGIKRRGRAVNRLAYITLFPLLCLSPSALAFDVTINGVEDEVRGNIKAYLENLEAGEYTPRRLENEVKQRAAEAMRPYGYYEPSINVSLGEEGSEATLEIDPGPQVTIEILAIQLEGDAREDPPFIEAVDNFPLQEGDALRHSPWDSLRNQLSGLALERGYFDSQFSDRRMEVRPYQQSARLYMTFASGSRYQFGDVAINGSHIEPERLQNLRTFVTGEPYRAEAIAQYNQRLAETGWFRSVAVRPRLASARELVVTSPPRGEGTWWQEATPERERRAYVSRAALQSVMSISHRDDQLLPIDVNVEPADRHQFEVGVGYATDIGPRLQFGWQQPWINRFGHSLNHDLYISAPEQRFSGRYRLPLDDPRRDSYQLQYGLKNLDNNDTRSLEATIEVARRWQFDNDWVQSVYLRTTYDDFTQGGDAQKVLIYYPGVQWSRTRTRQQRFPTWGDRQQFSVEYSDTAWGSDAQFLRVTGDTEWIRMLGQNNRFIGGISVGAIETDDFDPVPPSLRFFAGGDNSVRGYSYESLSPRNDEGRLRGGQQLLATSVEYQRRVTGNWWGATFVDSGDAFDNWGPNDLKTGAGLGVRWVSPVGPIRLDVAHPFDHEDAWRLHFSIGPEF